MSTLYQTMTVSIEAAKALQGVGFDLPTLEFFLDEVPTPGWPSLEKVDWNHRKSVRGGEFLSRPDILTAVMWLWEKYGVWCEVCKTGFKDFSALVIIERFVEGRGSDYAYQQSYDTASDPLTAYNQAIIAACEWVAQNKQP